MRKRLWGHCKPSTTHWGQGKANTGWKGRKPRPILGTSGPDRLWQWLRDRGRPNGQLGTVSQCTLGTKLVAEHLGVSERQVRRWAAELRAQARLTVLTYARHTRGLRGGTWKIWLTHEPREVGRVQRNLQGAWIQMRGERHHLGAWRLQEPRKWTQAQIIELQRAAQALRGRGARKCAHGQCPVGTEESPSVILQERLGPEPRSEKALRWGIRWLIQAGITGKGLERAATWLRHALQTSPPRQILLALWRCIIRSRLQEAPEAWLVRCLNQRPRPRRRKTATDLRPWRAALRAKALEDWNGWVQQQPQTP